MHILKLWLLVSRCLFFLSRFILERSIDCCLPFKFSWYWTLYPVVIYWQIDTSIRVFLLSASFLWETRLTPVSVQRKIQNYSCGWKWRELFQGEPSLDNLCLRMQLEEQGAARELHKKFVLTVAKVRCAS